MSSYMLIYEDVCSVESKNSHIVYNFCWFYSEILREATLGMRCRSAISEIIFLYEWPTKLYYLISLWFALAFPNLHETFIIGRGRPFTDIPCMIFPGILKSSQPIGPIGDDPTLCMALSLTYHFVRYLYELSNNSGIAKTNLFPTPHQMI